MHFDATVVVWVPTEVQADRAQQRDGCDREEVMRRMGGAGASERAARAVLDLALRR